DVEHDSVEIFPVPQKALRGALPVTDYFRRVPFCLQIETQSLRQVSLIFDNQHTAHDSDLGSPAGGNSVRGDSVLGNSVFGSSVRGRPILGNSRVIVVPRPSPSLSAKTLPPCF